MPALGRVTLKPVSKKDVDDIETEPESVDMPLVAPGIAWKVGAVAPPLEVSTWLAVPVAVTATADVPLPKRTPLAVSEEAPVPPLATVSGLLRDSDVIDVVARVEVREAVKLVTVVVASDEAPDTVNDVNVPTLVIFPCTAEGSVDPIDGTPPALVMSTPLFAVVIPAIVLAEEE